MPAQVYTGIWTDYSLPFGRGLTLTLSSRDGALLLSFISAFVTITAGQLWSILCFTFHQLLVSDPHTYHDVLYYQRQNILRNSATPYGAASSFVSQAWSWRGRSKNVKGRTLGWALGAWAYALIFAVAAVFSSQVSESASSVRLLESVEGCGHWATNNATDPNFDLRAFPRKRAGETQAAVAYARSCYGNDNVDLENLNCRVLPKPRLDYTFMADNVSCPFGDQICWNDLAVRMETPLLDSRSDLGMNAPDVDRIQIRQSATCAPLATEGFQRNITDEEWIDLSTSDLNKSDMLIYDYGKFYNSQTGEMISNYTQFYNKLSSIVTSTYSIPSYSSPSNNTASNWVPAPELWSETAETSLIMVEFNNVKFSEPTEDAIFYATLEIVSEDTGETVAYSPDYYTSPVACSEQIQLCNPNSGKCTGWMGRGNNKFQVWSDLDVNPGQGAALSRLFHAIQYTTIAGAVDTRTGNALRAQEAMYGSLQLSLSPNQWHIEVRSWFEESLALLQQQMQEYALGPEINAGSFLAQYWTDPTLSPESQEAYRAGCRNQVVLDTQGTVSFSVLGLGILFGIGGFIILLSLSLETIVVFIRNIFGRSHYKTIAWNSDANLNVQQMLLQARGFGDWDEKLTNTPTLRNEQQFPATGLLLGSGPQKYSALTESQTPVSPQPTSDLKEQDRTRWQNYRDVPVPQPYQRGSQYDSLG